MDITKLLTFEEGDYNIVSYDYDIDSLSKYISENDLNKIIKDFSPYFIIYNSDSFLNPDWRTLNNYILSFHQILKRPHIIDKLFVVEKIMQTGSVNGDIIVLSVNKTPLNKAPQILLKVPKSILTDPISYEYYMGITLNSLRETSPYKAFAITYGLINCPIDMENKKICSYTTPPIQMKSGIFYEFIKTTNSQTVTLTKFINDFNLKDAEGFIDYSKVSEFNKTIISILKYIMLSIAYAQNVLQFTHYDLHLSNVILLKNEKLEKVNIKFTNPKTGKVTVYTFYMEYTPIIIDYGRSHIDPNKVISYTKNFVDFSTQKMFFNFQDMLENLWASTSFTHYNKETLVEVQKHLMQIKPLRKKLGISYVDVLKKYYLATEKSVESGINPKSFHPMYDVYRFTRTLCNYIIEIFKNNMINPPDIYKNINQILYENYPFFIPKYFGLPSIYEPFQSSINYLCKSPLDIIELCEKYTPMDWNYSQFGGGGSDENEFAMDTEWEPQEVAKTPMQFDANSIAPYIINDKPLFEDIDSSYNLFSESSQLELFNATFLPKEKLE